MTRMKIARLAASAAHRWFDRFFPFGALLCVDVSDCGLACAMCPRGGPLPLERARKGLMPPELFGRITDKFMDENVRVGSVWFGNWGEPLLNPALPEMVRRARAAFGRARITVFSNLNTLPDAGSLLLSGLDMLRVSLSGMRQETYARNHRGGDLEAVLSNLDRLASLKKKLGKGPRLLLMFHKYLYNPGEEREAREFCRDRGIAFTEVRPYICTVEAAAAFAREPKRYSDFYSRYIDLGRERSIARRLWSPELCWMKRYMVAVDTDGSLARCCAVYEDRYLLGSFFDRPIRAIGSIPSPVCGLCARTPACWR